jgi:hypothetical protein
MILHPSTKKKASTSVPHCTGSTQVPLTKPGPSILHQQNTPPTIDVNLADGITLLVLFIPSVVVNYWMWRSTNTGVSIASFSKLDVNLVFICVFAVYIVLIGPGSGCSDVNGTTTTAARCHSVQ